MLWSDSPHHKFPDSSIPAGKTMSSSSGLLFDGVVGKSFLVAIIFVGVVVCVFGLFNASMNVRTRVSAENGEVISTNKPWWAFLATEPEE